MLVLEGYFDESGTHSSSKAIAVAGYLSTAEQWKLFTEEWKAALEEFQLEQFHMTDFANRAKDYSSWTDCERNARFARLAAIIRRHTLASISSGFLRQSFDAIFDRDAKRFVGGPYGAAVGMCFLDVAERLKPLYPSARVAYVFESGAKGAGDIASAFRMNYADAETREQFKLESFRFDEKRQCVPLQAADILAYELYRQIPKQLGIDPHSARQELKLLVPEDERSIKGWGLAEDAELAKFARICQIGWKYHGNRPLGQVADAISKRRRKRRRKG